VCVALVSSKLRQSMSDVHGTAGVSRTGDDEEYDSEEDGDMDEVEERQIVDDIDGGACEDDEDIDTAMDSEE
jgi:hypothetical protein